MIAINTIAKPYAKAAFEIALAQNDLPIWQHLLEKAAFIAKHDDVKKLRFSARVRYQAIAGIFIALLKDELDDIKERFIVLLAKYRRLSILPSIACCFDKLQAQYKQVVTVEVETALALSDTMADFLTKTLQKRLQRQVKLRYRLNCQLLGGASISIGDVVIDGSIRGRLARLRRHLEE